MRDVQFKDQATTFVEEQPPCFCVSPRDSGDESSSVTMTAAVQEHQFNNVNETGTIVVQAHLVEEIDLQQTTSSSVKTRKSTIIGVFLLGVVVTSVVAVLVVLQARRSTAFGERGILGTEQPSRLSSVQPSISPSTLAPTTLSPSRDLGRAAFLLFIVRGSSLSTSKQIHYPPRTDEAAVTPEEQALRWLIEDDPLQLQYADDIPRIRQRYALATLYFAASEQAQERMTGWVWDYSSECDWRNVQCSFTNNDPPFLAVTQLQTPHFQASLPADIGLLTELTSLLLSGSGTVGTIPDSIGMLTHLTDLRMRGNRLSGGIPLAFSSLNNLQHLDLSNNRLNGTVDLLHLPRLQKLFLNDNMLNSIVNPPMNVSSDLAILDMSYNSLNGTFPSEMLQPLTSLVHLNMSNSLLSGAIPSALSSLSLLVNLNVGSNMLTGSLPDDLSKLTLLTNLVVSVNQLTGTIPESYGTRMRALRILRLGANLLTGPLPSSLGSLPYLQRLQVSSNALNGTLPDNATFFPSLETLHLDNNQFTGPLPSTLGNWTRMEMFSVSGNAITGTIPWQVGHWSHLRQFFVGVNQLTGTVPDSIGEWKNLTFFVVHNNNLTGTLPWSMLEWDSLEWGQLSYNKFTGSVPFCNRTNAALEALRVLSADCTLDCPCCLYPCTVAGEPLKSKSDRVRGGGNRTRR